MRRDIAAGVGRAVRVTAALDEDTWTLTGSNARNVQVVLVDVDRFGLQLVRDLSLVFPSVRIVALTNDPRRLAQSVRAGATIAVPRSTPPKDLARLIVQLAKRRR
jgi:DNA-binding NarL/FixJ family response regulator